MKSRTKAFLLIALLTFSLYSFTNLHKYYLSLTQINYTSETKALQMTMNVFVDDIERALDENYKRSFKLNTEQQLKETDSCFKDYLKKQFLVEVNASSSAYNYLGHEYEGDVVYFYMEIENVAEVTSLNIENKVLMDVIPEQQNLVKLKINKTFKSLLLTKSNDKGLLKF